MMLYVCGSSGSWKLPGRFRMVSSCGIILQRFLTVLCLVFLRFLSSQETFPYGFRPWFPYGFRRRRKLIVFGFLVASVLPQHHLR